MVDPGPRRIPVAAGVELHVEVAADGDTPRIPVLLISGADSPASRWRPRLVTGLVAAGHDVIRYDHRDIGRSSPAVDPYDLTDLLFDAVAVLDALGLRRVHVIGSSMGAMVGQLMAVHHPHRLATLTAVVSSPDPVSGRLSAPSEAYAAAVTEMIFAPAPTDERERVERILAGARLLTGSRYPFDEDFLRRDAETAVREGWRLESGHLNAVLTTAPWCERLAEVTCPVLVVAGTEDPLFGTDHAEAFVEMIPHARLEIVDGLGHEVPDGLVGDLLPMILDHLAPA